MFKTIIVFTLLVFGATKASYYGHHHGEFDYDDEGSVEMESAICVINGIMLKNEPASIAVFDQCNKTASKAIDRINFKASQLQFIPNNIFEEFSSLETLDVDNTKLDRLETHFFKGAAKLSCLNANNNEITELTANTFMYADKLEHINLNVNHIQKIDDEAFAGLPHLMVINLSHNQLHEISVDMFKFLPKLNHLGLSKNYCIDADIEDSDDVLGRLSIEIEFADKRNNWIMSKVKKELLEYLDMKLAEIDAKSPADEIIDDIDVRYSVEDATMS